MLGRKLRPEVEKALEELKNNPELQPIRDPPLRAVKGIQFGVLSPEEIRGISVCCIKNSRVANPPVDTVYDDRMGPAYSRGICATCNEDMKICPGHFGHIELATPIIHPMFIKFIVIILNCICVECSKLRMTREEIDLEINVLQYDRFIRYIDKLNIIHKKCANVPYCNDCEYPHPEIRENEGEIYKFYPTKNINDKKPTIIEVNELRNILEKISQEDLEIMGFQPQKREVLSHGKISETLFTFRPEWLILQCLPIIPPMSRPPDNEGDNRSDDDLTTSYTDIIKYNERLKEKDIKDPSRDIILKLLYKHISGLFDNSDEGVTRSSGKVAKGIKERISSKNGHIRGKLMGKRVDCSARTVITSGPNIELNEVGVPEEIAKALSFPEKVTHRNFDELTKLLNEEKINTIIRNDNQIIRVAFAFTAGRKIKLKLGDIAYRQLRDRDTVVFNRQPTLHRGSMMAHYVKVLPGKTFRLNLSVTTPYNADFDGDEMQLHVPQNHGAAIEVQSLMGVNKMIVSSQSNRPIMGVIQDSLLGSYILTYPNVNIPRHQFMDCVYSAGDKYVKLLPNLFKRASEFYKDNLYNGRVLFSILLPPDYHHKSVNNASKEEPEVIIKNGILIKGIIDKKLIGRSHGSIVHRLYKEYGAERSADFLSHIQFLVNRWLTYNGFSVGMRDFIISDENEKAVEMAIQKAYIEVETIQQSDDPENIKEFKINNTLNNRGQSLAINGLCKDNRLEVMINSGSKGNKMNIIQITGHLGQNNVEGKRIKEELDDRSRTLPCFKKDDKHPLTRGFIENSFIKGLNPYEFFFHAKSGREGCISTSVKTRDSGYAERKLVKRMEDLIIKPDYTIRNSVHNIIDFQYGDSLEPTLIYNNKDGPSFIDIDNIVNRLNTDDNIEEKPEDNNIYININTKVLLDEITQKIKEYNLTKKILMNRKDPLSKQLLISVKSKLTEYKKELMNL